MFYFRNMNWLNYRTKMFLIIVVSTGVYQLFFIWRQTRPLRIMSIHRPALDNRTDIEVQNHETNTTPEDYEKIAAYVQDKLYDIQNPQLCESAKKVLCDLPQMKQNQNLTVEVFNISKDRFFENQGNRHSFALFKTEDIPVIYIDFASSYIELERSIPKSIRKKVIRFHSDPQLWWAGQMASYILRPTARLNNLIAEKRNLLDFKNVIVGLQIRRTDKLKEAYYYNVTEYMEVAEKWFNEYEQRTGKAVKERKIFLVTDTPSVVTEAEQLFPRYTFINNMNATIAASKYRLRLKYSSLKGVINDIFLLSMCDYIVCTMSSHMCTVAFELMQARHKNASNYAKSLDCEYYIHKLYKRKCDLKPKRDSKFEKTYNNLKFWS